MGKTSNTVISDLLPVGIILFLMFFFLETAIGKKLLQDLWNLITKGIVPSDKGSTSDANANNASIVNSNSGGSGNGGGSGGGNETLVPPPDTSQTLQVKNAGGSSSGGGNGGGSGSSGNGGVPTSGMEVGTPNVAYAPTTTPSQRQTTPPPSGIISTLKNIWANSTPLGSQPIPIPVYQNNLPEQGQSVSKQVPNQAVPVQFSSGSDSILNPNANLDVQPPLVPQPQTNPEAVPNPLPQQPSLLGNLESSLSSVGQNLLSGANTIKSDIGAVLPPIDIPNPFLAPAGEAPAPITDPLAVFGL